MQDQPAILRCLVVDDNADSAEMLALVLRSKGHDVRIALSGQEALDEAGRFQPEFVLLDVGMPGMDGFQVVREMRSRPALAGTVVIATTGYGRAEDRQRSVEAGFDGHLTKPIDFDALDKALAARR